jgi:hypothetical protein
METSRFSPDPSPEEAVAVIAAIEQFLRDTESPSAAAAEPAVSSWRAAALHEGVTRQPCSPPPWA